MLHTFFHLQRHSVLTAHCHIRVDGIHDGQGGGTGGNGYHYIWNLKGPLPHIPLLASGGVNPETIPYYLEHGMVAVGTGISIINRDMLAADDYDGIAALARKHVEVIERYK